MWKRITDLLILWGFLGLLFFNYGNYWSAHWYSKWTYVLFLGSYGLGLRLASRTSLFLLPIYLVLVTSALSLFAWNFNYYATHSDPLALISLGKNAAYAFCVTLLFSIGLVEFPVSYSSSLYKGLRYICAFSILSTLYSWRVDPFLRGAFSGNASMNGCLIALTLPFLYRGPFRFVWLTLGVIAIAMTHTSIPFGVGLLGFATYTWARGLWTKQIKVAFVLMVLGTVAWQRHDLLDPHGRFHYWRLFMDWWWINSNHWFGAGAGSAQVLLPYIGQANKTASLLMWMHNEWLQIVFEYGYVGLASALLASGYLLYRAQSAPQLLSTLVMFMGVSLFNYPLRLPIHAVVLFSVVYLTLKGGTHGIRKEKAS